MNILVSAYAVSPYQGSEPGVGWNWIIQIAKYCNVFVITEAEFRADIEEVVEGLPQKENLTFYFNDIGEEARKMCWHQGDFRFYYFYRKWQEKTYIIAKQILTEQNIDIIHQLNMIGYREPGYLWKIKDIPLVWGPIGGFIFIPIVYLPSLGFKRASFFTLKNVLNFIQANTSIRVRRAVNKADLLIAASENSKSALKYFFNRDSVILNETGCHINKKMLDTAKKSNKEEFNILWVGRFIPTKLLRLALKTIWKVKHLKGLQFHIVGEGFNSKTTLSLKRYAISMEIQNQCKWYGKVSRDEVDKIMRQCDLFFFTSISEESSTVVMEAIANSLPVLCFNTCGHGNIVNEEIGLKIPLENPVKSVKKFAQKIEYLFENRDVLKEMSLNCCSKINELSWNSKGEKLFRFYQDLIK